MSQSNIRFSQNFLHDKRLVSEIVQLGEIELGSTVLEIGPGKGIITAVLADVVGDAGIVTGIEYDRRLYQTLLKKFSKVPQVKLKQADILQFDLAELPDRYVVFSNIPFNLTAQILEKLFIPNGGPERATLILQKDALMSFHYLGGQLESFKSLLIKPIYKIELLHSFLRSDYEPQPSVDTALFSFVKRKNPLLKEELYPLYVDFLTFVAKDRVGEGAWRQLFSKKQMKKGVQKGLVLGRGIKSQSVEGLVNLFQVCLLPSKEKRHLVDGSFATLRLKQKAVDQKNDRDGHHRTKGRKS